MGNKINENDLVGQRFNKLVVISGYRKTTGKTKPMSRVFYKCMCDCGNESEVRHDQLTSKKGNTKSCGCLGLEQLDIGREERIQEIKITEEKCIDTANNNEFVARWIGPLAKNAREKTWWECAICGENFFTSHDAVHSGKGCYECKGFRSSRSSVYTEKDYIKLADESYGISEWIGPDIVNTHTNTVWRCAICHNTFERNYVTVKMNGSPCNNCLKLIKAYRLPSEKYHELAKKHKYFSKWLGPEVDTVKTETWWECNCGEKIFRSYDRTSRLKGCKSCATKRQHSDRIYKAKEYHLLANRYGIKWIGDESDDLRTTSRTLWECKCGLTFKRKYNAVYGGSYLCKKCQKTTPYSERMMIEILNHLDIDFDTQKWYDSLRSAEYNMPLSFDFHLPEYNLLIELNGRQHYKYIPHFHKNGPEDFEYQKEKDERKYLWCKQNKINFLSIKYTEFYKAEDLLLDKIDEIITSKYFQS